MQIYAFKDIAPQAPVHILVIPKNRDGLTGIAKVDSSPSRLSRGIKKYWGICWSKWPRLPGSPSLLRAIGWSSTKVLRLIARR